VDCLDVAATIYAPDCWQWSQQPALSFSQLQGRGNSEHQRLPDLWRNCLNRVHPISEVINLSSLLFNHDPLYWSGFCYFLQDTVPDPLARTISYNIAGPISALGFRSPTLAQLMSRYATLDPTLIGSTSDKRKDPSLVAPSAAKKKRTTKKLLIQVRILSFLNIKLLFILIIFFLCNFIPEFSNHWSLQSLPMLHPLVKFSPSYFFNHFLHWHLSFIS
jgi:hypothetical protein